MAQCFVRYAFYRVSRRSSHGNLKLRDAAKEPDQQLVKNMHGINHLNSDFTRSAQVPCWPTPMARSDRTFESKRTAGALASRSSQGKYVSKSPKELMTIPDH